MTIEPILHDSLRDDAWYEERCKALTAYIDSIIVHEYLNARDNKRQ